MSAVAVALSCAVFAASGKTAMRGRAAPDFIAKEWLTGSEVHLRNIRGRKAIVFLYHTACSGGAARLARAASLAEEKYINSPIAVIGIASPESRGSAQTIAKKFKVDFPNGVDLAGATFALWGVHPLESFGFVVDEDGKIVYRFDLGSSVQGGVKKKFVFGLGSEKYLQDAKDPFGFDEVPAECKGAYALLKVGLFGDARAAAEKLSGSSAAATVAEKIVAVVDMTEIEKFERISILARAGEVRELQEEYKAFLIAFPKSNFKSQAKSLLLEAGRSGDGKEEAEAAKSFDRALVYLQKKKAQGLILMQAIGEEYEGTYYGDMAKTLGAKLK